MKTIALAVAIVLTASTSHYKLQGGCSYYADKYEGRKCADNRTIFHQKYAYSAHCTLPFGTEIIISNCNNGRTARSVVVDRGPFEIGTVPLRQHPTRILDVSSSLAKSLGFIQAGTTTIHIIVVKYGK